MPVEDSFRGPVVVSAKPANHNCPTTLALAEALPHARFVFPIAPKQRATVYKRSVIRQWFDDWHLGFAADEVDSRYDLGLQTTGLGRTVAYLHRLVAEEAALVGGTRNIILGGISQGCAASLVASLLWEGSEALGGVVGMCGWLPYISQMRGQMGIAVEDDVIHSTSGKDLEEDGFDPFDSIPVILCQGRDDEKVSIGKGTESAEFLSALGMRPACLKEYASVGHEFSAEMLSDIAEFIRGVLDQPSCSEDVAAG
ncbi:putative phospholipase carboxylesterase family protein [Diaporthe ampelina]|uniref:Putative phospholipase carboxylesterase family protein n=1 Tax=Diaporthe ampelina TaxID=1214573 RepID=A0A0G2IDJ9_9PEZI|nr:putative phospholipase carboxylesterase family protein [Diaporthe ampelina]